MKRLILPRYEIHDSTDGQWFWILVAANHEVICMSETFTTKSNARRAVKRARALSRIALIKDCS